MGSLGDKLERELVVSFLKRMKALAHKGRLHFTNREENNRSLAYLGIKYQHAREIVLNLSVKDYAHGVGIETEHENEEKCVFGVYVDGELVYIKLVIDNDDDRVKCISFHIAKWDMSRKFHEGGDPG